VTELEGLREEMRSRRVEHARTFERVHTSHRQSAANLVDYVTLRSHDVRALQDSLAELGLSSLGRSEEHVLSTIEGVLASLRALNGKSAGKRTESAIDFGQGRAVLESNATRLLGPSRPGRPTRILVTMPTEAADDPDLVRAMLSSGMDCARINCAHDDPEHWERTIRHIRSAASASRRSCPVLMDLPGPKLRTGPIEPGPRVVRLRPRRDQRGRPVAPARALLVDDADLQPLPSSTIALPVQSSWRGQLAPGDRITLRDTRNASRVLVVTDVASGGTWVDAYDTTYLESGSSLVAPGGAACAIGLLPSLEQVIVLGRGGTLRLTDEQTPVPAVPATNPTSAEGASPDAGVPRIGCTFPALLGALQVGQRVFFDDGRIGGVVTAIGPGSADIQITIAAEGGSKLRAEKGINAPDTDLRFPAVVPEDEQILPFIAEHADMVGLSFTQSPTDVAALHAKLDALGRPGLGIILKVETAKGFSRLPEILLKAMEFERVGVMVARGDLAVECGFERLAEVQEETLWLCDAGHLPVIWATQVLDQMAKTGQPSRAEVSDAALSGRAECVMLNKGPHIVEAITALDDILRRMSGHQHKKAALLRRLKSWSYDR
jgi:pyruvate kinase